MNVFMDARMFYHSGIGRYGRNLYRELLKLDHAPKITIGVDKQVSRCLDIGANIDTIPFDAPIYSLREQLWSIYMGWRYRKQFNLFHFPHYNIPWVSPTPMVVTCHDLIHLLFPQYFTPVKVYFARLLLGRVASQAKRIITVSHNTKQDFLHFFPKAEEKIRVIYNGVGSDFKPLSAEEVAIFKKRLQVEDFLLYVGNRKPHKNLPRLIAAYAQIRAEHPNLKLIILSRKTYNNDEVSNAISRWRVKQDVISFQPEDTEELALCYNAARLFVFPSLYEGFGLPVLEAMACGTPVVASNVSSIPEVAGKAAILVDPTDIKSIAAGIEQGLNDNNLRDKLRQAGLARAKEFSWQETARQTYRVYQETMR